MIEEPALRALVVHYTWALTPRFSDVRGAITELLRAETASEDDWDWDDGPSGPSVSAWDSDRRLHLYATAQGLDIASEAPADPVPIANDLLASCLETLGVPHVVRCGAVAKWLLPAASTGDASAALEHGLGSPGLRGLLQPLGGDLSRIDVDVGFEDDDGTSRFVARPVTAEELGHEPELLLLDDSDLPAYAVFAMVRRDRERPMGAAEAIELSARLLEEIREAGEDVLRSLSAAAS